MSVVLSAEKREKLGSLQTRKIRKAGLIPAVIYSSKGNINLTIDEKEFEHEYFKGTALTTVIELKFADQTIKAIPHKIELDPVSDRPVHVDFASCKEGAIKAKPKLVFVNQDKSPGLKKGGFLHVVLRKVEVVCENEKSVPSQITVDVGAMHVSQKFRANNLVLPAGVKLAQAGNFLIASITGRGKSEEDKAATAAPAAGAAAPAAGAAAAPKAEEKKPAAKK